MAESIRLNSGRLMPQVGLGTYQSSDADVSEVVKEAIRVGYRHIDTAYRYRSEQDVGQGIADAIKEGLVTRDELFVASKLPGNGHRKDRVAYFLKKSLEHLHLDYLDLYLIHSPIHFEPDENDEEPNDPHPDPEVDMLQTWEGMENCVRLGLVKSIGLSNYNSIQIQQIYEHATIKPANLQVECHAYLAQNELRAMCQKLNIAMTAYAPLGAPFLNQDMKNRGIEYPTLPVVLQDPVLQPIAKAHSKSPAQVLLRWQIQRGLAIIPKSKTISRIRENFDIFDFKLSEEEMEAINKLNKNQRFFLMLHKYDGVLQHPQYPFHVPY